MIWLTWRQHRKQALWTAAALLALAAVLVPTGLAMRSTFQDSGLGACLRALGHAELVDNGGCEALSQRFGNKYDSTAFLAVLLVLLPVLAGVFLGAPLVAREVENGTHRLVWTQGISRRRWILTKFGLVGAVTLVLSVGYALGAAWWLEPLADNGLGRLRYLVFDVQGIAPIGYTLFAVALGILAGTVARRVLPAMGISLTAFIAVRALVELFARPYFLPAKTLTYAIDSPLMANRFAGSWIYQEGVRNGTGALVLPDGRIGCGPEGGDSAGCLARIAQDYGPAPLTNWQEYQPADRFWTFQAIETGIFLALTVLLVTVAVRRVRRIS
ncbi:MULTISPECIES: ABC transporter permease [Kitasatospora]|uniref:ABC transporter permease n=1 Tax=Kitasatospora TaxID=2063 RepID=UPI0004BEE3CE|nr:MULTISPECIES: ABC transporter permease subunit [Kitasatospora]